MTARIACSLAPGDLARLKARLAVLVETYLQESDPSSWPGQATPLEQTRRYYQKRGAEVTLKQITALSQTIAAAEGAPDPKRTPESNATAATAKDARAKAKALREAAGIDEAAH